MSLIKVYKHFLANDSLGDEFIEIHHVIFFICDGNFSIIETINDEW